LGLFLYFFLAFELVKKYIIHFFLVGNRNVPVGDWTEETMAAEEWKTGAEKPERPGIS